TGKDADFYKYEVTLDGATFPNGGAKLMTYLVRGSGRQFWQVYVTMYADFYGAYGICGQFDGTSSTDLTTSEGNETSLTNGVFGHARRYAGELGSYYACDDTGELFCSIFWQHRADSCATSYSLSHTPTLPPTLPPPPPPPPLSL
ncbi:hypothetical protein KIPB_013934, partial [Kipferlia bialata]